MEEDRILQAQFDKAAREAFVAEHMGFICKCAAKASGRYVDKNDDLCSEASLAFIEALDSYDGGKGNFEAYAATVMRNKVIDYLRRQNKHGKVIPFSSLSKENEHGDEVGADFEDENTGLSDTAMQIYSLRNELEKFGISFFELPSATPKTDKTKAACMKVINYIVNDAVLLRSVYEKQCLPVKQILETLKVNKKIPERHRKYIIAGILIINGKYEAIAEYFNGGKRRCE